jgi:asparagine synthase (glutamine-hydrolysing)
MCGLCGEIRFDGQPADVNAVNRMTCAMASRGPDSEGVVAHGPIALGHRRLSIIDLSARGEQPMTDSDLGLTLVFNGCIYNHESLRKELEAAGYRFFSDADSEVVIKGFHHWGVRCVERFKGMFAFAIADRETGVLTLGRDRLGIKPLYLAQTPGRLRFASTVRALLDAGDVDTSIDRQALHHYMSFHSVVPAPLTLYRGVRKLPPATVRVVQPDGTHQDTQYWSPGFRRDPARALWSAEEWQEALMDALRVAVERRMVADVPVGVLLSGGIDSSIVVALLAEQGQKGLETFSIGFDSAGGESGDEYSYSDLIAKTFGTDHHRIHIDSSRLLPAIPKTIAAMSEPMVSHDCVAFYLLSEEVSKSVKVVQSGQGADEILAGYDWYPPLADVPRSQTTDAYAKVFFDRRHEAVQEILAPEYRTDSDVSYDFVAAHQAAAGADDSVDAALRLDTTVMLVDDPVKRVDTMTMAWGLEARVPFLDHDFVELAATCPSALKLAGGGKGVLKEASRKHLPAEVIDRTKGYFPVPGIRHLEGQVLDMVRDALTNAAARGRGLYRSETVNAMLAAPNDTRTTLGSNSLWQLAVLEMWLQSMEG